MTIHKSKMDWLEEMVPKHNRLTSAIEPLLKSLLATKGIDFLNVQGRTKSEKSILEKCDRKNYSDPAKQLTDISGIRIITFLESQVKEIVDLVRSNFDIDEENSLDRDEILGSDRMGYRSSHFICTLSNSRETLPEYEGLQGLKFELQIRTVLQHAWAELAHDRSFKLGLELPRQIQRKLNLYSGMLEIVDSAFDEIAQEVDEYRSSLNERHVDQIWEADINSISLEQYLNEVSKNQNIKLTKMEVPTEVIEELRRFGLETIGDLARISTPKLMTEITDRTTTATGLLRDIMMLDDLDKYFSKKPAWGVIALAESKPLVLKYGPEKLARHLNNWDIHLLVDDDIWVRNYGDMISAFKKLMSPTRR